MNIDYWTYNIKNRTFNKSENEAFSIFPTVVNAENRTVFCRKCHRWEYILRVKNDVLMSQCGSIYKAPFVRDNTKINYGYNIKHYNNTYSILVKSQIASSVPVKCSKIQNEYILNLDEKKLFLNDRSIFENEDFGSVPCKGITDEILNDLGEKYKKEFGFVPTVASRLNGFNVIVGYMLAPFNVNFYKIAQHWGLNPYHKEFANLSSGNTPTAENEMFESLGIKPTKIIRRMYQEAPQCVICYAALLDLGITDVNILQKCYSKDFYDFLKFYMISFAGGIIAYPLRDSLKLFCTELLELSSQKTVWNSIKRTVDYFTSHSLNNYNVSDGLTTYVRVHEVLTENEKKEILREGFNDYTHNFLVRRATENGFATDDNLNGSDNTNIVFDIEDKFLDLAYKAGDDKKKIYNPVSHKEEIVDKPDEERFCFYVARDSLTLQKIGSAMHNCVGWGYTNAVASRKATIVYAEYKNKYRICIEVTPDFQIRQSLGACNKPLNQEELEAYSEWCREKNIQFTKAFGIHVAPR